jgi:hypothetical protein
MSTIPLNQAARDKLFAALERAWSADTSVDPSWDPQNPARGQCAVTAVVVQDWLGGDLARAVVGKVSHYWNRLGNEDVDLTQHQFSPAELAGIDRAGIEVRSRDYVLSFPATARRYRLLKARVDAILREERSNEPPAD